MTRAASSPYLGGIGLMLEVAHMCPRCGQHLPDTPSAAAQHLSKNACRPTVYAALPEPERIVVEDDVPLIPAGRRIHDFETPLGPARRASPFTSVDVLPPTTGGRGSSRALAIPWLRPPDLGEVL